MNGVAQAVAAVSAFLYISVGLVEMLRFDRPWARSFLHVEADNPADVRMWAFVVGMRNVLAGSAALIGIAILHAGDPVVGRAVVLTATAYMLLASLAMAAADLLGFWRPRGGSAIGTVGSSLPPLAVLVIASV